MCVCLDARRDGCLRCLRERVRFCFLQCFCCAATAAARFGRLASDILRGFHDVYSSSANWPDWSDAGTGKLWRVSQLQYALKFVARATTEWLRAKLSSQSAVRIAAVSASCQLARSTCVFSFSFFLFSFPHRTRIIASSASSRAWQNTTQAPSELRFIFAYLWLGLPLLRISCVCVFLLGCVCGGHGGSGASKTSAVFLKRRSRTKCCDCQRADKRK